MANGNINPHEQYIINDVAQLCTKNDGTERLLSSEEAAKMLGALGTVNEGQGEVTRMVPVKLVEAFGLDAKRWENDDHISKHTIRLDASSDYGVGRGITAYKLSQDYSHHLVKQLELLSGKSLQEMQALKEKYTATDSNIEIG